jgi:hypothetical protein
VVLPFHRAEPALSPTAPVRVTVFDPVVDEQPPACIGRCRLLVESARPLPRGTYAGTVRIGGAEWTHTQSFPCRLLKHFSVEYLEEAPGGALYSARVDLASEEGAGAPAYAPPGCGVREVDEAIDVICKRIAGLFGRHCEQYRPPSVIVKLHE